MRLSLTSPPAEEPVSLSDAKAHLRVDTAADDAYIPGLITAARMQVERDTKRALLEQGYLLELDSFPWSLSGKIRFSWPPLISVGSITYVDANGVTQTWDPSQYVIDAPMGPDAQVGYLALAYLQIYPVTQPIPNAVRIPFMAGYGTDPATIPAPLIHAIKLKLGSLYTNREDDKLSNERYRDLISPFRVPFFAPPEPRSPFFFI